MRSWEQSTRSECDPEIRVASYCKAGAQTVCGVRLKPMKAAERQLRIRQMSVQGLPRPGNALPRVGCIRIQRPPRPWNPGRREGAAACLRRRCSPAIFGQSNDRLCGTERAAKRRKSRIAKLTAGLIEEGQTVILDGARRLPPWPGSWLPSPSHRHQLAAHRRRTGVASQHRVDFNRRLS